MPVEFFIVSFVLDTIPGTAALYAVSCGLAQGARGALWGAVSGALGVVPRIFAVGLGHTVNIKQTNCEPPHKCPSHTQRYCGNNDTDYRA